MEWINIKDNIPPCAGYYLAVDEFFGIVEKAEFDGNNKWNVFFTPTHWMNLPQSPNQQEKKEKG